MSYYSNPYLTQLAQLGQQRRQQQQQPHPSPFGQGYHQHQVQHPFATPQFNFYAPSSPSPAAYEEDDYSIEDEERAAIAHLRAIQRRKQVEQLQRQEVEREAALAQQYRAREIAQREREIQLARAMREREVALAMAKAQRERELEMARRAREVELARFAEIQNQRRQAAIAAAHQQQQAQNERQQAINEQRRRQCARHCRRAQESVTPAPAPQSASDNADVDAFNKWIGSLFGLQLPTDDTPTSATSEQKQTVPAPTEKSEAVNQSAPVAEAAPAAKTPESAPEKKAEFPEAINDLLSSFLGIRVDPESKLGEAVSKQANKVPEGLNELLNQFGLEFCPDEAEEKVEKKAEAGPSTTSVPAPAPATGPSSSTSSAPTAPTSTQQPQSRGPVDLAEFLSGTQGLPPFVRDILGNVELAFKERSQEEQKSEGKGKGVAEGEKKTVPTSTPTPASIPAPSSTSAAPATAAPTAAPTTETEPEAESDNSKAISDSISQLAFIESELALAKSQFTFPTTLSFGPQTSDSSPSLLFNKTNKPYHAQNNRLLQLLLQADGVASNGDREVRRRRKSVVKAVEGEIEKLERKRDEYWAEVKERRDVTGEVSENESWTTGSTVDHDEVVHVEDVAEQNQSSAKSAVPEPELTPAHTETEIEKPSTFAEAVKTTSDDISSAPAELQVEDAKHQETEVQEKKQKDDKEEGYELL